jgi:SAM-dependent methyltransferase
MRISGIVLACVLAACAQQAPSAPQASAEPRAGYARDGLDFPKPDRPVATIVGPHTRDETERDTDNEGIKLMDAAGARTGMTVADIGAGAGYLTSYLSRRVGPEGRVLAQDVMTAHLLILRERIAREGLKNVTISMGGYDDARLPAASVDLAVMIRMYHEIEQPYGLLWRLRASLKPGGRLAINDVDRPTRYHGTPPVLLRCELAAIGYREVSWTELGPEIGYVAVFEPIGEAPDPATIKPCKAR